MLDVSDIFEEVLIWDIYLSISCRISTYVCPYREDHFQPLLPG